jgi:hypothetical protein
MSYFVSNMSCLTYGSLKFTHVFEYSSGLFLDNDE